MFSFMRTSPIGTGINYRDYTFEGDGHLYAFQEAFHDLAEVDGLFAAMNCRGVNAYAKGYHDGGLTVARESAERFMNEIVTEGFFGNVKERLIKLLKTLKEKIKSFFHSAIQYFDAFFKDGAEFAEKYEDELRDKNLDGFKYQMFTYKQLNGKLGDCSNAWKRMKEIAISKAKSENVDLTVRESLGFMDDDWIGALIVLTETIYWKNKANGKVFATQNDGNRGSNFIKISSSEYAKLVADGKHVSSTRKGPDDDGSNDDEDEKPAYSVHPREENDDDDDDDLPDDLLVIRSGDKTDKDSKQSTATTVKRITTAQKKAIRKFCDWEIGKLSKMGEGDFDKQARKSFRDGQNTPRDIEPDIGDIIETLKKSKEQLSDIKDMQDTFLSDFDDEIDIVKGMDKSGDNGIRVSNHVAVFTIAKDSFMRYFNILKDVMIERNKVYKSCLSAALHYNSEKK